MSWFSAYNRNMRSQKSERGFVLEVATWIGVLAILAAYALLTFGVLEVRDPLYLLLNTSGSAIIILHSYLHRDYQPLVLNIIWLLVAAIGLARI